jgi:hypothetical protein
VNDPLLGGKNGKKLGIRLGIVQSGAGEPHKNWAIHNNDK